MLDRLKLELGHKEYFTDEEYLQFLSENGYDTLIMPDYNKERDQKMLLMTVLDVLEAVANDVDLMRKVETEFTNTSTAYKYLQDRIQNIKNRIAAIPDPDERYSDFTLIYTRN